MIQCKKLHHHKETGLMLNHSCFLFCLNTGSVSNHAMSQLCKRQKCPQGTHTNCKNSSTAYEEHTWVQHMLWRSKSLFPYKNQHWEATEISFVVKTGSTLATATQKHILLKSAEIQLEHSEHSQTRSDKTSSSLGQLHQLKQTAPHQNRPVPQPQQKWGHLKACTWLLKQSYDSWLVSQ